MLDLVGNGLDLVGNGLDLVGNGLDLVGKPKDRFSGITAHILLGTCLESRDSCVK